MEVGEDALDPQRVVRPPLDPVLTCPQQYRPCHAGTSSGRLQMTIKKTLTGCQVKPPDSCTPMTLKVLGPHELSHGHTDDQLECRLPWQSPRSIGLCAFSWYLWCCGSSEWTFAARPPGFSPSPVFRASAAARDITFAPVPSDSSGRSQVPWSIQGPASVADSLPGIQVSEVEIPQVDVGVFPLANTHLPGAILNACRYERRLAEAMACNANRNTHLSVRHFRGMMSSDDSPSSSLWDVNGGLINDNKTRWRSHLGMILRCTGRSSRKALTSSLMCGSAAGSYTQWRSTEATDVRCEIIGEGCSSSLKRCII